MRIKIVGTWDSRAKLLRLFRVVWTHGTVGDGVGYSAEVTFALTPRLFQRCVTPLSTTVVLLGVRVKHERSYGGIHV